MHGSDELWYLQIDRYTPGDGVGGDLEFCELSKHRLPKSQSPETMYITSALSMVFQDPPKDVESNVLTVSSGENRRRVIIWGRIGGYVLGSPSFLGLSEPPVTVGLLF